MPDPQANRITGSLLALALGDACGAPYEGGVLERLLWRCISMRNGQLRWTDDTQMTLDVVASLLQCGALDQDDLAARFARSYRWSRGYGPGAARTLKRIRAGEPWPTAARAVYAEGSHGNGGAMRAPAIGLYFAADGLDAVAAAAEAAALVTHAHPLAREGAVLIAQATALTLQGASASALLRELAARARSATYAQRLAAAAAWLTSGREVSAAEVAKQLGNGVAAVDSCVTAIYLAARFQDRSITELLDFTRQVGGDVDTIGAMAAAIWGAAHGLDALPPERLQTLEDYPRLHAVAGAFAAAIARRPPP